MLKLEDNIWIYQ